ncbi:hypothetical protein CALVIDRAFT_569853 [Calocera viscosa TUFC12733]|uniref:Uncharacterized protein n=1 Tax=Calocera viscosa (strain TUFC12733) TaxID=1330018 RepID=A0A167FIH1_CALVF|nr:hypothetical protein CALVIDRAFT_569853 [Calocera viscosa TUFC12733]
MSTITAAQSTAMKNQRLGGTLAGYDQITVVSQGAINFQLAAFPALYPGMQKVDIVDDESGGELHVTLVGSEVELLTSPTTSTQVNYTITVGDDGGANTNTFSWWSGFGKNQKQTVVSANNWKITFTVDLSLNPETSDQDIPASIRAQILKPGDYSVLKLVFDFTTANVVSNSVGFVTPGLTQVDGKNQLVLMMQDWIAEQAANTTGQNNVLGYVMTTTPSGATPNGNWGTAPTVPPTALKFQNLGYIDPTTGVPDLTGHQSPTGDNNMLVYLEMTQKHGFPTALLQPVTNWVIPPTGNEPALDGLMALAKNVFLEGWFLPQLQQLNSNSAVTMLTANWSWDVKVISCYYSFTWTSGVSSGTALNFTPDTTADNTKSLNYIWTYSSKAEDDHSDIAQTHTTIGSTSVTNKVSIPWGLDANGQCVVSLSGTTSVHTSMQIELTGDPDTSDYHASWTCNLIFASVKDGGLNITQSPATVVPTVSGSVDDSLFHGGSLDSITTAVSSSLQNLPISNIVQACHLLLNGPWGFHFSGGTTFFMQGIEFSKEGDLMLDLSYKS